MCIGLFYQNLILNGSEKISPIILVRSVFRTRFLITFSYVGCVSRTIKGRWVKKWCVKRTLRLVVR